MNWLAKLLFYILSVILHPLLVIVTLWLIFYSFNPYAFGGIDWSNTTFSTTTIRLFVGTAFLPAFAIFLIRKLGLIDNLKMEGIKERIVPLTIACLFYFWVYLNIGENDHFPDYFQQAVLGVCLTLLLAFFNGIFAGTNLFAASSICLILALVSSDLGTHRYYFFADGQVILQSYWIIFGLALLTGLYLSLRLYWNHSTLPETITGILVAIGGGFLASLFL